ncbi:MAG: hypothetical protein RLZZ118_936 [Bacteroidota bacterium]|jgi:hypothetical protein
MLLQEAYLKIEYIHASFSITILLKEMDRLAKEKED